MTTRREVINGLAAAGALAGAPRAAAAPATADVLVKDAGPRRPISATLYGDNAVGTLYGERQASAFARAARVTSRRLGGNLMTTYNWVNNCSNSGKDWKQWNGATLPYFLDLSDEQRDEPASVIHAMHETAQAMGAMSLVTLPLAGYVAADGDGEVSLEEIAPSPRWTPVVWRDVKTAEDPIDPSVCDVAHLLRRLQARYGDASASTGVQAYALDNEPGLWHETHPRVWPEPIGVDAFIARSVAAARVIRAIDPHAMIFGPCAWGATAFLDFHGRRFWKNRWRHRNFIAAYLAAFKKASEEDGVRLLDCLDVHWYPYHHDGNLGFLTDPSRAAAQLDAPRSLTERGFIEDSWVGDITPKLRLAGLSLPILPSLQEQIDAWFPGTRLAVTEFNFGGPELHTTGLAVADALGRFGEADLLAAHHWGPLDGAIGEAYRLYRGAADGEGFADHSLGVTVRDPARLAAYAASDEQDRIVTLVLINKEPRDAVVEVGFDRPARFAAAESVGFDALQPTLTAWGEQRAHEEGRWRLHAPARSAQRLTFRAA